MRPRLTTTHFEEVGFSSTKTGTCPACGKPARRTQRFYQTLNPWNTNAAGQPKTRQEIIDALRVEAEKWKQKPTYHAKCADAVGAGD